MGSIEAFNALTDEQATALLTGCLDVPRWVKEVLTGRPYATREGLLQAADAAARTLTSGEVDQALAGHPRIGERAGDGHNVAASEAEQAGIDTTDADLARRLAEANAAYEHRFDRVFLIRAAGRTTSEVLAEIGRRLTNDDASEEAEVVDNLREITLLRLNQEV